MPQTESTENPYLELVGVRKRLAGSRALEEIALAIDRGELVTFLGPSGCGKTTLLRIIAGLETQDSGVIVQDGRDISRLPGDRARLRHRVPVVCAVPQPDRSSTTSPTVSSTGARAQTRSSRRVAELLKLDRPARRGRRSIPGSYPAASSSASRSRARWRRRRACFARRAAVGARRARAPAAARRDPRAAAAPWRDDDHGHARPGRSAVDGRPGGRDEPGRRSSRSARRSRSIASPRRRSSPISWARSTCISAVAEGDRALSHRRIWCSTGASCERRIAPGTAVKLYLRPEDVVVDGAATLPNRARSQGDQDRVSGRVLPGDGRGRRRRGTAAADQHLAPQIPTRWRLAEGSTLDVAAASRVHADPGLSARRR